jgi:hypothetical protein
MVGEDPASEVEIVTCKDSDYSHQWAEDVVYVFWVPKYKYSHTCSRESFLKNFIRI